MYGGLYSFMTQSSADLQYVGLKQAFFTIVFARKTFPRYLSE